MEAMAAGIPVVASDIPGCRYLVDNKNGLLFQQDQPKQLANAIKILAIDPSLRDSLRRETREFINSSFSAARMAKEYVELFSSYIKIPSVAL